MPRNAILGYLDLVSSTRYQTHHTFFEHRNSFAQPEHSHVNFPQQVQDLLNLPIHSLLVDIEKKVIAIERHEAGDTHKSEQDLADAAQFFEPLILHHWQLVRLLDGLRCNTPIVPLSAKNLMFEDKAKSLRDKLANLSGQARVPLQNDLDELEAEHAVVRSNLQRARQAMQQDVAAQENVQAALVLASLLNVVFRKGMSAPMLSDQLHLEAQQKEYRDLLEGCGIAFKYPEGDARAGEEVFPTLFRQHPSLIAKKPIPNDPFVHHKYVVSLVVDTQGFHTQHNHWRLGGTRLRRLGTFLVPFLKNETYTSIINTVDPFVRRGLAYINWIFFIPRLTLNFSILFHHLFNENELNPLEAKLDRWTRFRAHWTRFWFEVINDLYWFLNGIAICFMLNGGVLSTPGLYLSMTVQCLDLLSSMTRACMELYRLYKMRCDLQVLQPGLALDGDLLKRLKFEAFALGYMVFHFALLVVCLALTLPSMAAVSTMLPVVGGTVAVMMTVVTYYMQNYLTETRRSLYEPRPKPLPDTILVQQPSHAGFY